MEKVISAFRKVTDFVQKKPKVIILVLALGNAFGIVAPDHATSIRDAILALI